MTQTSADEWIKESAEYIKQKKARDAYFEGRELKDGQELTLRDEIKEQLKDIIKKAEALHTALMPLRCKVDLHDIPFHSLQAHILKAWDGTLNALVESRIALQESIPLPRTREKPYHQTAVRLAVSFNSGPGAREMAKLIIEASDLEDYSEAALTGWLKQSRSDLSDRADLAAIYSDNK